MNSRILRAAAAVVCASLTLTSVSCIHTEYSTECTTVTHSNVRQLQIDWQEQTPSSDLYAWSGRWSGCSFEDLQKSSPIQLTSKWTEDKAEHVSSTFIAKPDNKSATQPDAITIKRDSGMLTLARSGEASLRISTEYLAALSEITGQSVPPHRGLEVFSHDLKLSYARAIRDAAYKPTFADLINLDRHGVKPQFAKAARDAGYDFSIADLIDLDRHGVSADTVRGLKEAGFNLTASQIVDFDRHGIGVAYARDMRKAGIEQPRDIIELDRHGISGSYVQAMGTAGYTQPKDLIELDRHGISKDYAAKLKQVGYTFSVNDLIELDRHGVGSDYAAKLKEAGYDFSAQDLIKLDRHGVSSSFAAALAEPGKPKLSCDTLVDLSNKGIDAATIKKIRGS